MEYRREIDGLRALAVVPVVLFHAGFSHFGGGFVGVDIFFVISGYLITSIILQDVNSGCFSTADFYERRVRRILPALFLVMAACIPVAWIWLLPIDMKSFSQSLIAVTAFVSNVFFWSETGYFDISAELKPLLHTWSLSVEEQYYLLFPIFLTLIWRAGKQWVFFILLLIFLTSLSLSYWGTYEKPAATFYLLPTRGWEILLGCLVAFYLTFRGYPPLSLVWRNFLGAIGFIMIVGAVFLFDKGTPFPGLNALIPTMGASLIILSAMPDTAIGKLLGNKFFVGIGLISYSAYLWHQPLFAFARQIQSQPTPILFGLLSLLSFVLAFFSWKYVETPFREKKRFTRKRIFLFAAIGSAIFLAIGLGGHLSDGYRVRFSFPPNIEWMSLSDKISVNGEVCKLTSNKRYEGLLTCEFGRIDSAKTVVLYGDSHAQAISQAVHERMSDLGYKVILVDSGCGVIFDITSNAGADPRKFYESCNQRFEQVRRLITENQAVTLLATRWTFQYFPIDGVVETLGFDNGLGGVEKIGYRENLAVLADGTLSASAMHKKVATKKLIDGLATASNKLFLIYPIPEIGWDIFKENIEYYQREGKVLQELAYPYQRYLERNAFVLDILNQEINKYPSVIPIRADHIFCEEIQREFCVAQKGGIPYYYDDDHLSDVGSGMVVDEFASLLKDSASPSNEQ